MSYKKSDIMIRKILSLLRKKKKKEHKSPIRKREKYETPKIKTEDSDSMQEISNRSPNEKRKSYGTETSINDSRQIIRRRFFTDKANLNIIKKLNDAGIKTEQPFYMTKNGKRKIMDPIDETMFEVSESGHKKIISKKVLYEKRGESFRELIVNGKLKKEEILRIAENIGEIVGKMQALGVYHYHPHFDNFVVDTKKMNEIRVIDFKLALNYKKFNWNKYTPTLFFFIEDHKNILRDLLYLGDFLKFSEQYKLFFIKNVFSKIVSQYPTSEKNKLKILKYCLGPLKTKIQYNPNNAIGVIRWRKK